MRSSKHRNKVYFVLMAALSAILYVFKFATYRLINLDPPEVQLAAAGFYAFANRANWRPTATDDGGDGDDDLSQWTRALCEKVSMAEQTDFNCILSYKQLHKLATMKLNCLASYRLHDFDASVMQPKTIAFAPSHSIWWSPEKFKYTFFCFTTCRLSRYSIWLAQLRNCTQ